MLFKWDLKIDFVFRLHYNTGVRINHAPSVYQQLRVLTTKTPLPGLQGNRTLVMLEKDWDTGIFTK